MKTPTINEFIKYFDEIKVGVEETHNNVSCGIFFQGKRIKVYNGKTVWSSIGAAKNAFSNAYKESLILLIEQIACGYKPLEANAGWNEFYERRLAVGKKIIEANNKNQHIGSDCKKIYDDMIKHMIDNNILEFRILN
jgi:hypothetical protein